MTIRPELIEKLRAKRAQLTENVSPEKLEALHAKGLLSARERLETLFDRGHFPGTRPACAAHRPPPSAWRDAFYPPTA
jgi:acetyl-CoA carboxylase carboxyltransferase component